MWLFSFFFTILFFISGCSLPSKTTMYGSGGRTSYNKSAQNTTNQELLLNLVRLRYSDTPYFLELNNIKTQFTRSGKISPKIKIPGVGKANPADIGGELMWNNQPTIEYSPLQGKDFATQLMEPLSLRLIQGLIFAGWDVDRVFRVAVQSMANIPNACSASGPIPNHSPECNTFKGVVSILRDFQKNRELQVGAHFAHCDKGDVAPDQPNILQIVFPSKGDKADRLSRLLPGVRLSEGKYIMEMEKDLNNELENGIMTRSILSSMYFLSLGINIPPKFSNTDVEPYCEDGKVCKLENVVKDIFQVHFSTCKPKNSYLSVQYKNNWFFIDDADINSKRTFVLLQQIYNLQARSQE